MHIENLTINLSAPMGDPGALVTALLREPAPEANRPTAMPPKIGQRWVGQGGIYAGLARGEEGQPDHHLVLSTVEPDCKLDWAAALEWAKTVDEDGHTDFAVPTRMQSALLYANLRDQFDTSPWYWTSTQDSGPSYAWLQYFFTGSQSYDSKSAEARVRAVRRLTA